MADSIDRLFGDLQSRGFAKDKTLTDFRNYMLAPGEQGYRNRKQFFDDFKSQGMTDLETYEDFAGLIGLQAGKPERVETPSYQPSAEEMAGFQRTINSANRTATNPTQGYERKEQLMKKRQGLNVPQRVSLGESNNLTPTEQRLNPETGELEQGYMTSLGNEYDNKAVADMEQRQIDQFNRERQWEHEHPEESLMGQIDSKIASLEQRRNNAYAAAVERARAANAPQSGIGKAIHDIFTPNREGIAVRDVAMDIARQDKDVMALDVALRDLQEAKTMMERNRQLSKSSDFLGGVGLPFTKDWFNNWKNFGYGVWDAIDDVAYNFAGTNDAEKAKTYLRIKDKMERGEELTDSETNVAIAGMSLAQAQQLADLPTGYTAGQTTLEMAPFMLQMASNPASGIGKALARKAVRQFGRDGLGAITARVAARVAGNVVEAGVLTNTWQAPRTMSDIAQRYAGEFGYDDDGNLIMGHYEKDENGEDVFVEGGKSLEQSVWEGEASSIIENFTELGAGGSINGMLSKAAGTRLGQKMGLGYITDLVGKVGSTPFARSMKRFMERTHWDGMIEEPLEEEYGIILNSLLTGDNKISDLWDGKTQADIFAGTMWLGGMMAGLNTAVYPFAKRAMRRKLNNADVEGEMAFRDEWPTMKAAIEELDDKKMADFLYGIKDDDNFTKEQKAAMFGYAARLKQYQGANVADMLMRMENNLGENEAAIKGAYDAGTDAETPDEMKTFVDEATAAGETISKYGKEFTAMIVNGSADPAAMLDYLMNNRSTYSDEEIAAAADYYQKNAKAQGVMDAAMDRVDVEVERQNAEVRGNTHQQTGSVVMAKGEGDMDYYIIGGDIVTDPDTGMTSLAGTGGAVVVKDAVTGEVKVDSPQKYMMYSMQNADELIQQNETTLREQLMQQADDDITFGSPANEMYELEDTVTINDGNGGTIEGTVVTMPNAIDGVYVVQTSDGKALQLTGDDLNRRIVAHNGQEVQRATRQPTAAEPQPTTQQGQQPAQQPQQSGTDNAAGENARAEGSGQESTQPQSALSRIPVRTDANGQPVKNKKDRPILDWHKASTEDAAEALIETTGGDVVMARDTASDLVRNEQARLEKIRKQKPKGEDPQEIAESRMEIRRQEQEAQAIIKQWQDVGIHIRKQMEAAAAEKRAAEEAAKSEEQKAREAEAARIRQEQQEQQARERRRKQVEEEVANWNKPYGPLSKARKEMASDPEAMEILNRTEPETLEEWVSSLITPQSMMWDDETDPASGRTVIGLQSELGLQKKDIERIGGLVASRAKGGKPFGQVVHDIWEQLPEGMKNQYDDQDVRNALIGLFGEGNTMRMRHLTEEHRIEQARQTMEENRRRDREAEMDAWAEAYHLTPEERETFEDWLQLPPTEPEQEIINQIIADNEQNQASPAVDRLPDAGGTTGESEAGEGQVQGAVEASDKGDLEQTVGEAAEEGGNQPSPADNGVSGTDREVLREFLRQVGADPIIVDRMSDYDVAELTARVDDWEEVNSDYGQVIEEQKDALKSKNKAERDAAKQAVDEAQAKANEAFEAVEQYIEELQAKYMPEDGEDFEGAIPNPEIDLPRYRAIREALMRGYAEGNPALITAAAKDVQQYVDEGLNAEESDAVDIAEDYDGNDPVMLADQYIIRTFWDRYLDEDADQEYIRTGLKPNMRQIAPSEQLKPTDLRDNNKPDSAKIGESKVERWTLSEKRARNGEHFYQDEKGQIDLVHFSQELFDEINRKLNGANYTNAPLRLTESMVQHVFSQHSKELHLQTLDDAADFIIDVMLHFDHVRQGDDNSLIFSIENGRNTTGKRAITILLGSDSGDYYGIKTSGFETLSRLKKRPMLWEGGAKEPSTDTATEPVPTRDAQQSGEQSGSASGQSGLSEGKDTKKSSNNQENHQKSSDLGLTSSPEQIAEEEGKVNTNPSEGQKEAGNYQKGHIKIDGLDISIENPKGSVRRGTDASGRSWEAEMHNTYGYIRGTEGADGDHIDVFLSDNPTHPDKVFIVQQRKKVNGAWKFDELKVLLGFDEASQASNAYLSNYEEGWNGMEALIETDMESFKDWLKNGNQNGTYKEDGAWAKIYPGVSTMVADEREMPEPEQQEVRVLRGERDNNLSGMDRELPKVPGGRRQTTIPKGDTGQNRREQGLLQGELQVDGLDNPVTKPEDSPLSNLQGKNDVNAAMGKGNGTSTGKNKIQDTDVPLERREDSGNTGRNQGKLQNVDISGQNVENGGLGEGTQSELQNTEEQAKTRLDNGKNSNNTDEHKVSGSVYAASRRETVLRDALIEQLQGSGVTVVTDAEEGQRILDEYNGNGQVKKMGQKTNKKKAQIAADLEGMELTPEQQAVVDVYTGKKNNSTITFSRDGKQRRLSIRKGNEKKAGAEHSLFRHYGTTEGEIASEDVLKIPEILSNGDRHPSKKGNGNRYEYTLEGENGKEYTVVTEFKDGRDNFIDFYSSWKVKDKETSSPLASNTPEGAHSFDEKASSGAKVQKNPETAKDSERKFFRTPDGHAYGYTYQGKIYIDPRIATAETPVHEYGHLWCEMKRNTAPEEWNRMKQVMLTDKTVQPIIDKVRRDYPELAKDGKEDDFIEEIITQFSGKRGSERLREIANEVAAERGGIFGKAEAVTAMQRLKNILNSFWEGVARMMGWKYRNANQIADRIMADMLNGVNPRERMKDTQRNVKEAKVVSMNAKSVRIPEKQIEDLYTEGLKPGDAINMQDRVLNMSPRELIEQYRRVNSQMLDENGLDIDQQEDAFRRKWADEHGWPPAEGSGFGKASADYMKSLADKYTYNKMVLRWDLLDRIKELGLEDYIDKGAGEIPDTKTAEFIRMQMVGRRGASEADRAEGTDSRMEGNRIAEEMENAGKDVKAIKLATGWERGKDGQWRYEIPDADVDIISKFNDKFAEMKADGVESPEPILRLGELLGENNELFKYYPKMKDMPVLFTKGLPNGTAGAYDKGAIELNTRELNRFDVDDLNNENVYGTLLHEVQHAIQDIEGFAKGGSLMTSTTEEGINAIIGRKERQRADIKTKLDANRRILDDPEELQGAAELDGKPVNEVKEQLEETVGQQAAEYDNLTAQIERIKKLKTVSMTDARNLYRDLAGEVESRNVTERMGMTDEQRRQSLASETEDVARDDQVVIMGDGPKFQKAAPVEPEDEPVNLARKLYEDAIRDTGERSMIPALLSSISRNNEGWIRFKHKFAESWFDYSRSIKALQDAIEKATGKAIEGFEDVWRALNSKSSIDSVELQRVMHDLIEPLSEYTGAMIKGKEIDGRKMTIDDVEIYLNAVHGIERNEQMAMKQARDEYEEDIALQRQQLESGELGDRERKSLEAALLIKEARFKGISNYMDRPEVEKWYNQWRRSLENARRNGTISEDEYNKASEKMDAEYNQGWQYKYREKDYSGLTALFGEQLEGDEKPTEDVLEQAARDYASKFEDIVGKEAADGLWERVKALNTWSLRKSYESGLISKDQYNDTLTMYQHYVPLRGWHDDYAGDVYQYISRGEPAEVLQGVLKKAYGRKSRAARIFGTMAAMANTAIVQGNKNLVGQRLLNMAMNHQDSGLLMVSEQYYQKTADGDLVPQVPALTDTMTADEMRQELERFEADMKAREDAGEVQKLRKKFKKEMPLHMAKWQEQRHAVRVMRGGREYMVYVLGNPRAAMAFNGLLNPNTQPGVISNNIARYMRFKAKMQTSLSPEFLISNFERDMTTAATGAYVKFGRDYQRKFVKNLGRVMPLASLKQIVKGKGADNMGGIFSLFRKYDANTLDEGNDMERYFKEFVDFGGMTGISYITKAEEYQASMEKIVKRMRQGKMGKVRSGMEAVGDAVEFANKGIENATRFATYMTSRQQGRSVRDSIFDAKEGSVNFNMKGSGSWGNLMARQMYLYVNPAMQALRMLGTWYENDPVVTATVAGREVARTVGRRFMKAAAAVMTASVGSALLNIMLSQIFHGDDGDDDDKEKGDWWALSEWNRYNFVNIINPFGKGYFHWSIPQELRPLWAMGQIGIDMAFGRVVWQRGLESMLLQLNNLSPLSFFEGGTDTDESLISAELRTLTPSYVSDFTDAYGWNKDFMGHPITNQGEWNKDRPEWQRAGKNTPEIAVKASRKWNELTGGRRNSKSWADSEYLNPSAVYYVLVQQFGGIGSMVKRLLSAVDQWRDPDQSIEKRNLPFLPKFYVETGDDYSRERVVNDKFWMYYNEFMDADHEMSHNRSDVKNGKMTQAEADRAVEERKADGTYDTWKTFRDNGLDYLFKQVRGTDMEREVKRMAVEAMENGVAPDYDAILNSPGDHGSDALWAKARARQTERMVEDMEPEEVAGAFDKTDDPRQRKEMARRISRDAGASKDPYGDKPSSDHAYQYQLQRTAEDVREDAVLLDYQEKLRERGDEEAVKRLSNERRQVHSPVLYLHGGKSDKVIMNNIRRQRKALLKRYGLISEKDELAKE